ncbi:phospholipid-translocating P-type ATPase [Auriculariales sp. MPI-PUGE-AT-0066]|nr:phospholipid-translocating P-type ATPase [Auriculariales sp. MPI-PUGE-AT-0066]
MAAPYDPHLVGPDGYDPMQDPALRLRTVRTAASTIAESIASEAARDTARRKRSGKKRSRFLGFGSKEPDEDQAPTPDKKAAVVGPRRNIHNGEPIVRYLRNKIKTSKYTPLTFVPKNLFEQFRRVANLYFLMLVVLQVIPLFGAAGSTIAWMPLAFILSVTAAKDGVEDYRRASQDTELNNSPATRLSTGNGWQNFNVPRDSRTWFEKLTGTGNKPDQPSRGVRKLRERLEEDTSTISIASTLVGGKPVGASQAKLYDPTSQEIPEEGGHHHKFDEFGTPHHQYPPSMRSGQSMGRHSEGADTLRSLPGDTYSRAAMQNVRQQRDKEKEHVHQGDWEAGHRHRALSLQSSDSAASTAAHAHRNIDPAQRAVFVGEAHGQPHWERTLWKKVEVGDVILLRDGDQIPADLIVLATSDPQGEGMCYVETKNLDGETNLKARKSLVATRGMQTESDMARARFILDSEGAQLNLYVYNGVLRFGPQMDQTEAVTITNMLLRGCTMRNTDWVVALVVYTGGDTKILLNGGATPSKRSKIEKETNFNVVMNFLILIVLCTVTAVMWAVYHNRTDESSDYFEGGSDPSSILALNALITFASCLIAFQNIVPISLYISIEIVKLIQAFFISQDIEMVYAELDVNCVPKTWNISDDLGQIAYVFSDKTGTLTRNVMEFQKCAVRGVRYGDGVTEAQRGALVRRGERGESSEEIAERLERNKGLMINIMRGAFNNRYLREDRVTLISEQLGHDLADTRNPQHQDVAAFFRALALCHTVLSDKKDESGFVLEYKAESPDEAALVSGARDAGFAFVERAGGMVAIEVMGQREAYTPLRTLEFTSARKRMSVLLREPNGRVVVYCKGADSIIYSRLSKTHDEQLKTTTRNDLDEFANEGLRTLCVARRYINEEVYRDWERRYDAASAIVGDERDEEVEKICDEVECDLEILGATALEDKLQEGVPECIELLHQAGIKLWILTGDKVQTAIEIAFSCNLLTPSMDVMILAADTAEAARAQIQAGLDRIARVRGVGVRAAGAVPEGILQTLPKRGEDITDKPGFAVVIDGDTLRFALDDTLKPLFLDLGTQCDTVVCCRVSPSQKALTVKLVKEGRNAMTLSIGDGANDVAMIQEANIGCGLFGHEGSQAAMSADYAFGQFRYLSRLLLVHGHWSYQRIADMHGNFFYKNVVWTLASFWYCFYNSFDATYLYEYTFVLLVNLIFTSLPVVVLGSFDQDVNAKALMAFPKLYERGIKGLEYTRFVFWTYMIDGVYQSAVVFFIPYLMYWFSEAASWNGKTLDGYADYGTTCAVSAICAVNLYVGLNTRYWTIMTWIINIGSCLLCMTWVVIYSFLSTTQFRDEVIVLFGNLQFWSTFALVISLCLMPRFIIKYVQSAHYPLDRDIVREAWVDGNLKDQLGIAHRRDLKKRREADIESRAMDRHLMVANDDAGDGRGSYSRAALSSPAGFNRPLPQSHSEPQEFDMNVIRPSTDAYHDPYVRQYASYDGHDQMPQHQGHNRVQPSAMSYYSASDIPMSSPVRSASRRLPSDSPSPANAGSPLSGSYSPAQEHFASHNPYSASVRDQPGYDRSPTQASYGQHLQPSPSSPSASGHPPGFTPSSSPNSLNAQRNIPSPYSDARGQLSPQPTGQGAPPSSWRPEQGRPQSRLSSTMSRESSFHTADDHWDEEEDDDTRTVREGQAKRDSASTYQGGYAM